MKGHFALIFSFFICHFFFTALSAQTLIKGQVKETFSGAPLPFVTIIVNNGDSIFFSDIDGGFTIAGIDTVRKIIFTKPLHRTVLIENPDDSISITLNKNDVLVPHRATEPNAQRVIKNVLQNERSNSPEYVDHLCYNTYNKLIFTTEKPTQAGKQLNRVLKKLSMRTTSFSEDQHLLIAETYTENKFLNDLHQKEIISAATSSGINVPSLFIRTAQYYSFSPYDDFINITGKDYIAPVSKRSFKRYIFTLAETIPFGEDTIFIIRFNPRAARTYDALKGFLYINSKDWAIMYMVASPGKDLYMTDQIIATEKKYNGRWFKENTVFQIERKIQGQIYHIRVTTYIEPPEFDCFLKKSDFDEFVVEVPESAVTRDSSFFHSIRKGHFTKRDSLTYQYYNKTDKDKRIQRFLVTGENFIYNYIPVGKINLDIRRFFATNRIESLRLGIGFHTNSRLSKKYKVGGYFGYGFKDQRNKYGVDGSIFIRENPWNFVNVAYSHDLTETGGTEFFFDKYQYPTEGVRKARLSVMDLTDLFSTSFNTRLFRNFLGAIALRFENSTPLFRYQFRDIPEGSTFQFQEIKLGFRYSLGEPYLHSGDRFLSLDTWYPVYYFQVTQGLKTGLFGDFNYTRVDIKVQKKFRFSDLGNTGVQLIAGFVKGIVPYEKLYNGRGSLRSLTIVTHNSFETMAYNEFLSDRFLALFFSHNLGKLYFNNAYFRPSLLLLTNIGWGKLSNRFDHRYVSVKTMEKGYFESGMFLDNLITFRLQTLKGGIGSGLFLRYGPYAHPEIGKNVVFKFSFNLRL